jgi:hypothetical protein
MKINEILAEAGKTYNSGAKSAFSSFLRGAGATQSADAIDAYKTANATNPNVRQISDLETDATDASNASIEKMQGANAAAATAKTTLTAQQAAAKRARFIAVIKQQADRQGSISMTDIGKQIPKQGEYADPIRRREAIKNVAQELQQQGVTVTSGTATPQTTTASAPLPTIGGIGPNDPRYAALAAKTKNAPATPVR